MPYPKPLPPAPSADKEAGSFFEQACAGALAMFAPANPAPELALQAWSLALRAGAKAFSSLKIRPPRQPRWNAAKALGERARDAFAQKPAPPWVDACANAWLLATEGFGPQERALAGAELPPWMFDAARDLDPWSPQQARLAARALLCQIPRPRMDLALSCLPAGSTLADPAPDGGPSLAFELMNSLGWPKIAQETLRLWTGGHSIDPFARLRQAFPDTLSDGARAACLAAGAQALSPGVDAFGAVALGVLGACGELPQDASPGSISREDALALMLAARADSIAWAARVLPRLAGGAFPDLMLAAMRKTPSSTVACRKDALEACLAMAQALQADPQAWPQGCLTPGTRQHAAPARLGANPGEAAWACALACGESPSRPLETQAARALVSFFGLAGFDVGAGSPSALDKLAKQKISRSWRAFAEGQSIAASAGAPSAAPRPRL